MFYNYIAPVIPTTSPFPQPRPEFPEVSPEDVPEQPITQKPTTTTTQPPPPTSSSRVNEGNCRDPSGVQGVCKSIRECQTILNEFIARQKDNFYIQYIKQSNARCNNVQPYVCCPFKIDTTTSTESIDEVERPLGEIQGRLLKPDEGCGFSNATHKRIVGGGNAVKGMFMKKMK